MPCRPSLSHSYRSRARCVLERRVARSIYDILANLCVFHRAPRSGSRGAIAAGGFQGLLLYLSVVVQPQAFGARAALLTIALLIGVPVEYGAFHVFRVAEDMLTARSMAEALALGGLSLHTYGRRNAGLALAVVALSIHALIAVPMVLLLLSLRLGTRGTVRWALAAIAVVLCMASAATLIPEWAPSSLAVMDPNWLDIVRERSQFVFLQLWAPPDWEANARPFLCLTVSILVIRDKRVRTLCSSAMVGAAGLAIALIAGVIGPVALLLQGQAWRWTWVTGLASVLMLAPTVLQMWRSERCGSLCAVLLLADGWSPSSPESTWSRPPYVCGSAVVHSVPCGAISSSGRGIDRRTDLRPRSLAWGGPLSRFP